MFVKTITVKQTVQVKQFCPVVVEVTAELLEEDDADECAQYLRQKADFWVNRRVEEASKLQEELDEIF